MAGPKKKFPPSHAARAKRVEEAYAKFLGKMAALRKKRKGVMVKYLKRIEDAKIAQIKKKIDSL